MGADQSHSGEGSFSLMAQKARESGKIPGISPRMKDKTLDNIVVVNAGDPTTSNELDPDIKRLKDIPEFLPIMRSQLALPGVRDSPEILTKFDSRAVLSFFQRLQRHLTVTSEVVAAEQTSLGQRIREIDFAIATLNNYLVERQKRFAKHQAEFAKVSELSVGLRRITMTLPDVVDMIRKLNELLPPDLRLAPLNVDECLARAERNSYENSTDEQKVVDLELPVAGESVNELH